MWSLLAGDCDLPHPYHASQASSFPRSGPHVPVRATGRGIGSGAGRPIIRPLPAAWDRLEVHIPTCADLQGIVSCEDKPLLGTYAALLSIRQVLQGSGVGVEGADKIRFQKYTHSRYERKGEQV